MTYVEVLREKRDEVMADIERLRAEAALIASRIAAKEGQLHNLENLLALETANDVTAPEAEASGSTARSKRFIDAAYEMLVAAGRPLYYRDMVKGLAASGIYVPGRDPAANLLAHMSRDPRFARGDGRGLYRPAEATSSGAAAPARRRGSVRVRRAKDAARV